MPRSTQAKQPKPTLDKLPPFPELAEEHRSQGATAICMERYAEWCARLGKATGAFKIFPCVEGEKRPAIKGWQEKATWNLGEVRDIWKKRVGANVVHAHQWYPPRPAKCLCGRHADQQRTHEPGPIGYGDRVQRFSRTGRDRQGLFNDRIEPLDVRPRRNLRHDAAILAVQVYLRGDGIAAHVGAIDDHGRRRFVTRRIEAARAAATAGS